MHISMMWIECIQSDMGLWWSDCFDCLLRAQLKGSIHVYQAEEKYMKGEHRHINVGWEQHCDVIAHQLPNPIRGW